MWYLLNNLSGFIEFEDKYDAEDAIKDLDDTKLCGERVKLELSKVLNACHPIHTLMKIPVHVVLF